MWGTGRGCARFTELNLAELGEVPFRAALGELQRATAPVLCFVDEADSRPTDPWPYEAMLPTFDLGGSEGAGRVFLLAGSSGGDLQGMKAVIGGRPKGPDLLPRIPHDNEYAIPPMSSEGRLFVASSAVRQSAEKLGKPVGGRSRSSRSCSSPRSPNWRTPGRRATSSLAASNDSPVARSD